MPEAREPEAKEAAPEPVPHLVPLAEGWMLRARLKAHRRSDVARNRGSDDEAVSILRQSWYAQPMTAKGKFWPGGGIGALAALLAWAWPAAALSAEASAPPKLDMPIRCTPGETCWITKYVDWDETAGRRDYRCGPVSSDRHQGTDIAIRDLEAMRRGVAVVAAAPGVVFRRRDGMEDVNVLETVDPEKLKGKCGNGVFLRHSGGWSTGYCHMRKGSIAVDKGDRVKAGQRLGFVGMSGSAQYPHVHFQVMHKGKLIDPFVGTGRREDCALGEKPLWKPETLAKLPYRPTALYNGGFAATAPKPKAMRDGRYRDKVLPRKSPALVLWVDMFAVKAGDELMLAVTGPNGETILKYSKTIKKTQARRYAYAGVRRKTPLWPAGVYKGEIRLVRENGLDGREEYSTTREVTLR